MSATSHPDTPRTDIPPYDVIGFDADDTLWQSEDGFRANELRFVELVAPFVSEGIDVKAALTAVDRKNLHTFGAGVKAFADSYDQLLASLESKRLAMAS